MWLRGRSWLVRGAREGAGARRGPGRAPGAGSRAQTSASANTRRVAGRAGRRDAGQGFSFEPQIWGGNVRKVRRAGPVRGATPMRPLHGVAAGHRPPAACKCPSGFSRTRTSSPKCASTASPSECVPSRVSRARCAAADPGVITSLPTSTLCNCLLPSHLLHAISHHSKSGLKQNRVFRAGGYRLG